MKRCLIILLLVVLSANLFAQSNERKGFIGITLGPSMPIGDFGNQSLSNFNAGFAKTGLNISLINFGYRFGTNFGIAGTWFGAANPVNINNVTATWSYGSLMVGPMLTFPINKKLDFDLKGMIGYVSAKMDLDNFGETSLTGVGFDFGTALRYNFSERWCLLFNADYFSSNSKSDDGKQKIAAINLAFGVGYRLR